MYSLPIRFARASSVAVEREGPSYEEEIKVSNSSGFAIISFIFEIEKIVDFEFFEFVDFLFSILKSFKSFDIQSTILASKL